jgi:hypothetical protein
MQSASLALEGYIMQDKTYNGWTNYATWLVNLEMFSAVNPYEHGWIKNGEADSYGLSLTLKDYLEEYIYETTSEGIARDCALAFISLEVNWREIAEHMVADYCEEGAA